MNIIISRAKSRNEFTHGRLTINGKFVCHTLENTTSRVPAGEYTITLVNCKQYARKMLCLSPAPPCSQCPKRPFINDNSILPCYCPMLKPGNGAHNRLDGSILVGKFNCLNSLIHPRDVFDPLYERIRKSLSRGHKVKLTIVDG